MGAHLGSGRTAARAGSRAAGEQRRLRGVRPGGLAGHALRVPDRGRNRRLDHSRGPGVHRGRDASVPAGRQHGADRRGLRPRLRDRPRAGRLPGGRVAGLPRRAGLRRRRALPGQRAGGAGVAPRVPCPQGRLGGADAPLLSGRRLAGRRRRPGRSASCWPATCASPWASRPFSRPSPSWRWSASEWGRGTPDCSSRCWAWSRRSCKAGWCGGSRPAPGSGSSCWGARRPSCLGCWRWAGPRRPGRCWRGWR